MNIEKSKKDTQENELSVKVALRVRPLLPKEIIEGSHNCIKVDKSKN